MGIEDESIYQYYTYICNIIGSLFYNNTLISRESERIDSSILAVTRGYKKNPGFLASSSWNDRGWTN